MSLEQEIKLLVSGKDKLELSSLVWLCEFTDGEITTQHLSNTYFDTPNMDLRRQDIGLRLRQKDDAFLQTVKTVGVAKDGLHQRDEWEHELSGADWDLEKLKLTPLATMISDPDIWSTLQPIFTTNFIRETMQLILPNNTYVELAYDRGQVVAGSLSESIHEIELELKQGSVEQLKKFATVVCSKLTVKRSDSSKAMKGYCLIDLL